MASTNLVQCLLVNHTSAVVYAFTKMYFFLFSRCHANNICILMDPCSSVNWVHSNTYGVLHLFFDILKWWLIVVLSQLGVQYKVYNHLRTTDLNLICKEIKYLNGWRSIPEEFQLMPWFYSKLFWNRFLPCTFIPFLCNWWSETWTRHAIKGNGNGLFHSSPSQAYCKLSFSELVISTCPTKAV